MDPRNWQSLFSPGKFIFAKIGAKRAQNGPPNIFFWIFWKILYVSFSWKYSKMKTNIFIDISPTYLAKFLSYGPKCCQPMKFGDSLNCNILRKKWMISYILHADKHWSLLQVDTITFGECNQACTKNPK